MSRIWMLGDNVNTDVIIPGRYNVTTDRAQLAFKQEADPHGMLNPGKMIGWENPDFDFEAGRVWLFEGLQPVPVDAA